MLFSQAVPARVKVQPGVFYWCCTWSRLWPVVLQELHHTHHLHLYSVALYTSMNELPVWPEWKTTAQGRISRVHRQPSFCPSASAFCFIDNTFFKVGGGTSRKAQIRCYGYTVLLLFFNENKGFVGICVKVLCLGDSVNVHWKMSWKMKVFGNQFFLWIWPNLKTTKLPTLQASYWFHEGSNFFSKTKVSTNWLRRNTENTVSMTRCALHQQFPPYSAAVEQ